MKQTNEYQGAAMFLNQKDLKDHKPPYSIIEQQKTWDHVQLVTEKPTERTN